ncbi:uncharacterized protein LOC120812184 [Gasterosteus aculeatus]
MLQDKDKTMKHMSIYNNLHKRLQNVKSPQNRHGPTPERGQPKKRSLIDFSSSDREENYADSSGASTIIWHQTSGSSSDDGNRSPEKDSLIIQARHYKTLQEMFKKTKRNKDAVHQILDLEFEARRAFIDSDAMKEENRPTKILDAYLTLIALQVMSELQRILDKDNITYIDEVKKRWEDFCAKVQFYGVSKKVMKPPMNLDAVEYAIAVFKALPALFPSPTAPPKKLGNASEALLHVLQPTEPTFRRDHSLHLFCSLMGPAVFGTNPITTFAKEDLCEG